MNIQLELDLNDKQFGRYLDQRFPRIFLNHTSSDASPNEIDNPKTNNNNDSDDDNINNDPSKSANRGMIQWNTEEKALFLDLLRTHGRDWGAIAEGLPRKTDKQCRNYFQNYKHKLNLMQYLPPAMS